MKRVQLFEFEDFTWFPRSLRTYMTRVIVVLQKMMKIDGTLAQLITKALEQSGERTIVDLGSGSGGSMPDVMRNLHKKEEWQNVEMTLSDRYPDPKTIEALHAQQVKGLSYSEKSIDAGSLEHAPQGLKTMINSFHHMPPDVARKILASAHANRQPMLIYEMADNSMPLWLWWLQLPLGLSILFVMNLFLTPFVRPLTVKQLIFTYLIPILPLAYAWDGQTSYPRMYAPRDFDELLEGLSDEGYSWQHGPALNDKGKKSGYYVLGMPAK